MAIYTKLVYNSGLVISERFQGGTTRMDDGDTGEEFWITRSESLSRKDEERSCLILGANLEFAENRVVETSTTKRDAEECRRL